MDNVFRPCLGSVRSNHLRFRRSDRPLPHGIRCVQLHGPSAARPGREAAAENPFGSRHRRPGSIAQAAASLRESAGAAGSRSWTMSSRAGLGGARRRWAGRHRLYPRTGKRLLAIAQKGAMNLRTGPLADARGSPAAASSDVSSPVHASGLRLVSAMGERVDAHVQHPPRAALLTMLPDRPRTEAKELEAGEPEHEIDRAGRSWGAKIGRHGPPQSQQIRMT